MALFKNYLVTYHIKKMIGMIINNDIRYTRNIVLNLIFCASIFVHIIIETYYSQFFEDFLMINENYQQFEINLIKEYKKMQTPSLLRH